MDNKIKNHIFYSSDVIDFFSVFRQAALNNDKIINQFADMIIKGEYDKVLVFLEEKEGSSRWNHTVLIKYECLLQDKVVYRWTSNYGIDYVYKE
jgi:hypothetical protein